MDSHPSLVAPYAAFAVAATVLPAAGGSIATSVIWDAYRPQVEVSADVVDYDGDWASFRRDEVADLQSGDRFTAPRVSGAAPSTYRIVRVDRSDPELFHVAVA